MNNDSVLFLLYRILTVYGIRCIIGLSGVDVLFKINRQWIVAINESRTQIILDNLPAAVYQDIINQYRIKFRLENRYYDMRVEKVKENRIKLVKW